jgi:glycosyltransferase involved in cell wall biosynthesis
MPSKILLVIPSLAGAGAERVLVLLSQYLDRNKFTPLLIIFEETNNFWGELPPDLKIICLRKRNRYDFFRLIKSLAKIIKDEEPDLIISFLTYTNYITILARHFSKKVTALFLTEHSNLTLALKQTNIPWIKGFLVRLLYPKATRIICVSHGTQQDLVTNFHIPAEKCLVINNPVDIVRVMDLAREDVLHVWFQQDVPIICTCGRLTVAKNFPLLLEALKLALSEQPLRLVILGQGGDRSKLETYAKTLGISNQAAFLGFQPNPFKYMAKSTSFVLSSSWEGFGNVIIEAMACGVPVISTNCPSGPEEIITDGENGLLVPVNDARALASAMLRLLRDETLRKRLSEAGQKRAEDFRVDRIVRKYENVLLGVEEGNNKEGF